MKFQWKNAVVLTVVCALVGAVVALSYAKTAPLIERHAAEAAESARRGLFPEAECFEELDADAAFPLESCCAVLQGGRLIGYTGQLTVNGSQGKIEIIAGMDTRRQIVGVSVGGSSFSETPGMGAKVRESAFTDRFRFLTLPVRLGENVDGISGATVSSTAVAEGVNRIGECLSALLDAGIENTADSAATQTD